MTRDRGREAERKSEKKNDERNQGVKYETRESGDLKKEHTLEQDKVQQGWKH